MVAPKENIDFWCHYCFGQAEHTYEECDRPPQEAEKESQDKYADESRETQDEKEVVELDEEEQHIQLPFEDNQVIPQCISSPVTAAEFAPLCQTLGLSSPSSPMTSLTATCVPDVTVEHRRKSCLNAAELRQQQTSSFSDVTHIIHQDVEKRLLMGAWINEGISYGPSYIVGKCRELAVFFFLYYRVRKNLIFTYIFSAARFISNHKSSRMAFSDERAYEEPHQFGNIIEVREKNIVEDFDSALQQPLFDLKASRPLVVITKYVVEGEDPRQREVVDYGGPKIHACTTMLDNFVYHRLNLLSSTGKFPTFPPLKMQRAVQLSSTWNTSENPKR